MIWINQVFCGRSNPASLNLISKDFPIVSTVSGFWFVTLRSSLR
jgi:hypothetical protein